MRNNLNALLGQGAQALFRGDGAVCLKLGISPRGTSVLVRIERKDIRHLKEVARNIDAGEVRAKAINTILEPLRVQGIRLWRLHRTDPGKLVLRELVTGISEKKLEAVELAVEAALRLSSARG